MEAIGKTYDEQVMTLTEFRYIVAVAKERHFGRAAERCYVSQPTLSVSVRKLEDELGVKIFERTKIEVIVTEIGKQVITQAERALDEAERVKHVAAAGKDQLRGALRLGVIHTIAPYLLPDLVAALRDTARDMPLDIEENTTENLDRMLREGAIDVAVLALPYDAPGIETQAIYDEEFKLIVPKEHPWAKRRSVAADELRDENLLLLSIGHCFRDQVLEACSRFNHSPESGKQGNSLETLRSMVASGLGITVLPETALTERYENALITSLALSKPVPSRRVAIAWRQGFYRPRAVALLAKTLRALKLPIRPVEQD
ncbi:MAG: LysR substrate-binding domain-containing protein [Burkholderiales bacterium]